MTNKTELNQKHNEQGTQAYPVVLRKLSPVMQSLDVAEWTNQKAGAQVPSICLSNP